MPKMKTHRGAAKRFKVTGTGKIVKNSSNRRHKLGKKSSKRKRQLRIAMVASQPDAKRVQELLPYK
ncbi:MAG: 50S ribosomal protein L35 [Limnochordia bacterium]|nr:50S ribosomal protein L35 [Limnochordia bacterium]MDI9464088.1 50S ribosomal protein L35 [Bacillota bacterium]NLO96160.1 50S ribosomal protein L35 [Bacillota bacterium]HAN95554.1 50S ribosomal protein L35 [Bacillota bacterium]HOB41201.1 50S ribosomal protein L35 [Limnochordia bacterium]